MHTVPVDLTSLESQLREERKIEAQFRTQQPSLVAYAEGVHRGLVELVLAPGEVAATRNTAAVICRAFAAAFGLSIRGRAPEAFPLLRQIAEAVCYATIFLNEPTSVGIWLERQADPKAFQATFGKDKYRYISEPRRDLIKRQFDGFSQLTHLNPVRSESMLSLTDDALGTAHALLNPVDNETVQAVVLLLVAGCDAGSELLEHLRATGHAPVIAEWAEGLPQLRRAALHAGQVRRA